MKHKQTLQDLLNAQKLEDLSNMNPNVSYFYPNQTIKIMHKEDLSKQLKKGEISQKDYLEKMKKIGHGKTAITNLKKFKESGQLNTGKRVENE